MHPDGLLIRIPDDGSADPFMAQALCSVSFPCENSFGEFLGDVVCVRQLDSDDRLVLISIPQFVTMTGLRHTFRVPVVVDSGLEATVTTVDKHVYQVTVNDISMADVEIEFADDPPSLAVGMMLAIELRFGNEAITWEGQVRRVDGALCELMFPDQDRNQNSRQIALTLQQHWVKSLMN